MANYKIDKSAFDEHDLAEWDRLVAKGMVEVDPEAAEEEMEDEKPAVETPKKKPTEKAEVDKMEETKKGAPVEMEVPQFVKDAIAKSEEYIANAEKKEMANVAKKYEILGGKTEELADQLYELKKSNPAMYDTCIAMMDNQLNMIEKSGLFQEIGKSTGGRPYTGGTGSDAVSKADAKAKEIMKRDGCDYDTAIAKAWEDPALMAEYDAEYQR